jgi:hypothetical protein
VVPAVGVSRAARQHDLGCRAESFDLGGDLGEACRVASRERVGLESGYDLARPE